MEGNKPRVSVILPSLNVADYIDQCIESVINQTLKNIEIICVDAESTDGTWEILQKYAEKDPRIKVVKSDIKSYGYQMNLGLDLARGEYIGIVETDDFAAPEMFYTLYESAVAVCAGGADIVKSNYYWYFSNQEKHIKKFENLVGLPYNRVINSSEKEYIKLFSSAPAIWSGLYRTDMLKTNNIRFNETSGASFQDTSFFFITNCMAKSIYLIDEYLLFYRKDNSSSSVNDGKKLYCICDEMHYFENYMEGRWKGAFQYQYMALKAEKYRWNYCRISPQYQWDFLLKVREEFSIHRDNGLLNESYFGPAGWKNINQLIDDPFNLFLKTCKNYYTRPVKEKLPAAQIIKKSEVQNPLISVIVPAFNSEDTIEKTLESIKKQTIDRDCIEIICIDDGSTDNTLSLMLDASIDDERFTIIRQLNLKLSTARNRGVDLSRGKYIQFVDSDDWLDESALKELVSVADRLNLDVLYFDGETVFENDILKEKYPYYVSAYKYNDVFSNTLKGVDYFNKLRDEDKYRVSVVMALYKKSFLKEHDIWFEDGLKYEDNLFTFRCLSKANRVWHINNCFYKRYLHAGSIMTSLQKSSYDVYCYLRTIIEIDILSEELDFDERLFNNIGKELAHLSNTVCSIYSNCIDKDDCYNKMTGVEATRFNEIISKLGGNQISADQVDSDRWKERMYHNVPGNLSLKELLYLLLRRIKNKLCDIN